MNMEKVQTEFSIKKLIVIFFLIFTIFTKTYPNSWNDASRMNTIESLVERGTFIIDNSTFFNIGADKVFINGHFYSDKPPVLSFLASGLYLILHKFFNLSFNSSDRNSLPYYLLTLFICGLSSVLLSFFFYKSLSLLGVEERLKYILVGSLIFGTLVFPYTTVFNNHIVAACLLFISFYLLLKTKFCQNGFKGEIFLTSFLTSLAATIDIPSGGIFFISFLFYILADNKLRKHAYIYLSGALIPLSLHALLNIQITGDLKPAYLHPEYFKWEGSPWLEEEFKGVISGIKFNHDLLFILKYSFHCLFGYRGLFSYSPILLFSLPMFFRAIKNNTQNLRKEILMIFLSCFLIVSFYVTFSTTYGGMCYGMRFFIPFTPLIFFISAIYICESSSERLLKMFYVFLSISLIISLIGVYNPWSGGDFPLLTNLSRILRVNREFIPILKYIFDYIRDIV
ncbi:MAG: hypothetical protein ACE5K4_08250 [Candidatus Hydrothermarchaeota archaeon]